MDMGLKNRLTYARRLFLWLTGYSLLLVGCFIAFQYHREKEFKAAEINSQLQLVNTYIITELNEGRKVGEIDLAEFHPFEELRLSVISENGDVVYDNALDSLQRTNHLYRKEIQEALKTGRGYDVRRHSESTGEYYFYSAQRNKDGVIVRTAVPYSISLDTLLEADYGFMWIMGTVTFVMCLLGYIATRRLGLHIQRLNRFAENVEQGVVISDTEPFPHDELGDISNHIVRLYARLQQANTDRDNEHRAAMHEHREKERIKKQLTNNINHELKTPVAAIQVCLETVLTHKDMSEEKRNQFLQRCLLNSGRLGKLLTDVALITRMDDGGGAISKEQLNLTEIVKEVIADHEPMASSKGICIENDVVRDIELPGNTALLESVFNNLVDNAIAYSGGTRINVSILSETEDKVTLAFSDNGTGVPEEHLPRLFERFYRIDKGRSRAAGGTGLGLSIVKNAVIMHGGSISVENLKSGGLLYKITFSKT